MKYIEKRLETSHASYIFKSNEYNNLSSILLDNNSTPTEKHKAFESLIDMFRDYISQNPNHQKNFRYIINSIDSKDIDNYFIVNDLSPFYLKRFTNLTNDITKLLKNYADIQVQGIPLEYKFEYSYNTVNFTSEVLDILWSPEYQDANAILNDFFTTPDEKYNALMTIIYQIRDAQIFLENSNILVMYELLQLIQSYV